MKKVFGGKDKNMVWNDLTNTNPQNLYGRLFDCKLYGSIYESKQKN